MIYIYLLLEIFFLISFITFCINKRFSKILLLFSLLILILFLSFKEGFYYDFINYKNMFEHVSIENNSIYPEITYVVLSLLIRSLNLDFYWLQFLYYSISILFIYKGFRKVSLSVELSFLLFLLIPIFFLSGYIAMRQFLSLSLFFFGTVLYILERKKIGIIYILISILFHYSTFLAVILIFAFQKILQKKYNILLYILFIFISFCFISLSKLFWDYILSFLNLIPVVQNYSKYLIHLDEYNVVRVILYTFLYMLILTIFFISNVSTEKTVVLLNLYTIGEMFTVLGGFSMNINRFANYFLIFMIPLIVNLIIGKNHIPKYFKIIILLSFIIILSVYYYIGILKIPDVFLDYKNILVE